MQFKFIKILILINHIKYYYNKQIIENLSQIVDILIFNLQLILHFYLDLVMGNNRYT